jgi:Gpi18-like mannosyltransferase
VWPAAAQRLADATTWPFHFWIKLPSIIADLIIGWLLYTWPRSIHSVSAAQRAALYLFNPIVLLISAAHGQFDALVILGAEPWFCHCAQNIPGAAGAGVRDRLAQLAAGRAVHGARRQRDRRVRVTILVG